MTDRDDLSRLRGDAEVARLRLEAAHAEIDRLRLTDAEREAVERAAGFVEELSHPETSLTAATLRELLERLGGGR